VDGASRAADAESDLALRLVRHIAAGLIVLAVSACASPGTPPGGPPDTQAPKIVRIAPDSAKTGVNPQEVVFKFDEVVNERPSGAATLDALFLISPRNGDTQASWHRSEIAVRPRRGFKKNTTYTITLLPGLSDLRGNTRNTGAITIFSTGPTLATGRISGTLFNWAEGRIVSRGLIEARPVTDTASVYLTATDSVGDFALRNIPPARYRVRGFSDDNNNRGIDPREPFDTVIVDLADSAKVEILAFVHDSVGTRLSSISVKDSVTLNLNFDNPLSVTDTLKPAAIRIRGSDSTEIPVASVAPPPPDTTTSTVRKPSRLVPLRMLIVRLSRPLRPKISYRVRVTDVHNLIGVAKTSERETSLPAAVAPPAATKPPTAVPPPVIQPPAPVKK